MKRIWILGLILGVLSGCGVKGDPKPPLSPAEIGRGEPTYRRAQRKLNVPNTIEEEEQEENDEENKQEQ